MFYINENILCKTVHVEGLPDDCEVTLIQLSIHKMKNISLTLLALTKMSCEYENVLLIEDINLTVENKNLEVFMNTFDLECLIKKPTCNNVLEV